MKDVTCQLSKYKDQFLNKRVICPCDWQDSFEEWLFFEESENITGQKNMFETGTVKKIDISRTFDGLKASYRKGKAIPMAGFVQFFVLHANSYGIRSVSVSGYSPGTKNPLKFEHIDYSKFDLVVTNPPFSKLVSFLEILLHCNIDFLIVAPFLSLARKKFISLLEQNRLKIGYNQKFARFYKLDGSVGMVNCIWLTTLPVKKRVKKIICTEKYKTGNYLEYVNVRAIDIPTISRIPKGYDGVMGVPVSYLLRHDPSQFEIIGNSHTVKKKFFLQKKEYVGVRKNNKIILVFARIFIKHKKRQIYP